MSLLAQWSARNSCLRSHTHVYLRRTIYTSPRRLKDAPESPNAASKDSAPGPKPDGEKSGKKAELGPLQRPLGVTQRPTTVVKTTTQKLKDLMDSDYRMAQRRHLIKEANKGYFHDLNMTRQHGGKTWIAPKVLIREDRALYLPNISGSSLLDKSEKHTTTLCFGKISVISMLSTKISEIHAKAFTDLTNARFLSNPHYQYIQVNLQENVMKAFLVNLFLSGLRKTVPSELQANYLISGQNMEYVREAMGMTNSRVGYVYLVDENLRIRWAGCADPTAEEIQSLESCTGVLLKRLERKTQQGKPDSSKKTVSDTPEPSP
ncbi:F1F0 ATP synthase assembly protein Atp10 [Coprinopsis cinerea okayama7|uniref:F1F0 ATP synthase assembly protein Atp10 n=1 Tax=Coprinopsis cinerea (strain Okayama-7 / 130 / ATCC MYA-4618 / FGSC 9003) TaxID=240176 RepID=A8NCL6_COPC7|nr:F1F0 ATP synthase assembly protein Atp10 [Coprinopsis cinerea okayama7\|eukprot:XP_001832560.1 F1F0 ATP synthase assembly protein Atp10 [Coprinopsis cinerea okayama7\